HPQSNGKLERDNRTVESEFKGKGPTDLDEARKVVQRFVEHYNRTMCAIRRQPRPNQGESDSSLLDGAVSRWVETREHWTTRAQNAGCWVSETQATRGSIPQVPFCKLVGRK